MRSQCGLLSSVAFTAFPTSQLTRFDSQPFWVLLLRRLHLPLPCLLVLACVAVLSTPLATTGLHVQLLGSWEEGFPVQLRGSREAGARVRTNVMVRDLDLLPHDRVDNRRLEVVADGTTLVSPLARWFSQAGCRPHGRSRRRKERTTRSWQGWVAGPSLSSSLVRLAVVGPRNLDNSCSLWHPPKPSLHRICSSRRASPVELLVGVHRGEILRRVVAGWFGGQSWWFHSVCA